MKFSLTRSDAERNITRIRSELPDIVRSFHLEMPETWIRSLAAILSSDQHNDDIHQLRFCAYRCLNTTSHCRLVDGKFVIAAPHYDDIHCPSPVTVAEWHLPLRQLLATGVFNRIVIKSCVTTVYRAHDNKMDEAGEVAFEFTGCGRKMAEAESESKDTAFRAKNASILIKELTGTALDPRQIALIDLGAHYDMVLARQRDDQWVTLEDEHVHST